MDAHPADGHRADRRTRVGVQSGDRLRRETLAGYLESLAAFKVVGRVARHDDVVALCKLERPAVMLLDAAENVAKAVEACRQLRRRCPEVCTLLIYDRISAQEVAEVREAGVDAVLPSAHGLGAVVATLHRLAEGQSQVPRNNSGLSRRQREILLLLSSGHSAGEIARLLRISPGTVENHKHRMYAKLNASSAVQAVARAAAFGLIDGQPPAGPPAGPLAGAPVGLLRWTEVLDHDRSPEPGRTPLAVVAGKHRPNVDRVARTLIAHGLAVIRDQNPDPAEQAHWLNWHRGPVVPILVDPLPVHWRAAAIDRGTVVVHSEPIDRGAAMGTLVAAGAGALISADHIEDHLVPVLTLVASGYLVMDRRSARRFVSTARMQFAERPMRVPTLTAREYDILRSIGRSHTVRQTARSLGLAVKTVENTQGHLFRKLGVRNRAEALAAAYSFGLLEPAEH